MPQLFPHARAGLALIAWLLTAAHALAANPPAGELIVRDAWVRQPPPGSDVGAAYLSLSNTGSHAVSVVAFDCPLAEAAMLHETRIESGVARMRAQAALAVAAGETVVLKPGGLHVMLHGLKQPLAVGQHVPLVLTLADGRTVSVSAIVRPIGSE